MVRLIKAEYILTDKKYCEYAGLSTDTKPEPDELATGSLFHEVDTASIYAYDESSENWVLQIELGGDGA